MGGQGGSPPPGPATLDGRVTQHAQALERAWGRPSIGLTQATLPRLDTATLGLRGLMLLAAAPNVGKTALAAQLGLDVVRHNPDACFLFVSLEMARDDIISRLLCNLSRLDWQSLVMGPGSPEGLAALRAAQEELTGLGRRMLILEEAELAQPCLDTILERLAWLKQVSGTSRALVLVDYLQVFPLPPGADGKAGPGQEDADHWRVGAMKGLRDRSGDAVLVISEVDKPGPGQSWAGAMQDVRGPSRAVYTPDMILLLQALGEEESLREIGGDTQAARDQMRRLGLAFQRLRVVKGRDGVLRDTINLTFFHRQSRFAQGFKVFI